LTNEQFDELDQHAKQTVLDAVKFAEQSRELPVAKLHDYVYFNGAKP
jgi:TPP-dependent pyruvate/acetoin dehydrogenase alpha subunit